jgi:hypothetical protein
MRSIGAKEQAKTSSSVEKGSRQIKLEERSMKKLWVLAISTFLALPVIALAQDPAQQNDTSHDRMSQGDTMKQGHSGKSTSVKGTVSDDGKTLVSDSDGKTWTIANPDAVKGHEGHHVELKGTADASSGEIQVASVKMLKGAKSSSMPKDSTQPPQ